LSAFETRVIAMIVRTWRWDREGFLTLRTLIFHRCLRDPSSR
jgi:hypothetical protein